MLVNSKVFYSCVKNDNINVVTMACDRYLSSLHDRYKIVQCVFIIQCRCMLGGVLEVEEVDRATILD